MSSSYHDWDDHAADPIVRPYALTGGRTRTNRESDLDLVAIVETTSAHVLIRMDVGPEHNRIRELCRSPLSVAEVASELDLPVHVVRVLLDDLLHYELIIVRRPASVSRFPDERILKEVIDGLHAL